MLKRFAALLCILPLIAIGVNAQGLDTKASKDDWEEINFEFNSSVLVDGFPSLLRLSELLQKNAGFKVKLEGHTDRIGGDQFNDKLGMARASTVRDFLVKYGARSSQFEITTRGKVDPKYPGQKPVYTKTDEARWMNRRVVVTVMDDQGRTVSAAGIGDAIRSMEAPKTQAGMTDCCSEVLKRLDRLDDIARALKDLADQNAALRRDLDAMKQNQQVADSRANQPQKPPPTEDVGGAVAKILDQRREPRFQVLGANIGADSDGHVTFTGKGRFFGPFADHYAFQAQAEYMYYRTQKEGQFDLGLVDRIGRFQAGLFASFKNVSLSGYQRGGTLGQASITLDYIFKWGKIGLFGTKGFLNNALIGSTPLTLANGIISYDVLTQSYLRIDDQFGAAATIGLWGNNYLEGNIGYIRSAMYGDGRAGGTLRFIFPINNKIAITVEGGLNETMIGPSNNGRAVVGVQFGNAMRPKDFLDTTHAVPVDPPRVRYEVVTRTVRVGHSPPVADAGPDQIGVPAGTITLNGSNSYSPDGLPITFVWIQDGGQLVSLTNQTGAITTFAASSGQTYIFRLVVTDSLGATGQARVRVTTTAVRNPLIEFFVANPAQIAPGQASTLSWGVKNATNIMISGIGNVSAQGSSQVTPAVTTTYTLTASNATSTIQATAVVVVNSPQTKLLFCYASPANIMAGESSTLFYQSQNATSVTINGVAAALGGSVVETPTQSTNYTIMANGPGGLTDTCNVAVTVTTGQKPRIIRFSAIPASISAGQNSTLLWVVENATSVSIDQGIGNVSVDGSQDVSPQATSTYTLTATNASGSVTAQATVTVGPGPIILSLTAAPNPSPAPGTAVLLTCNAANATSINVAGTLGGPASATATVNPQQTTVYSCIATGQNGQTAQAQITVGVRQPGNAGPTIVVAGGLNQTTIFRVITVDASGSFSPSGNNPLTYKWVSVNDRALIIGANTATPQLQLGFFGDVYLFNLTVTDSKGKSSTVVVAITLTI